MALPRASGAQVLEYVALRVAWNHHLPRMVWTVLVPVERGSQAVWAVIDISHFESLFDCCIPVGGC